MDWFLACGTFVAKVALTVGAKMAVNSVAPGYSSTVDFGKALYSFYQRDVVGGALNIVSGIADVYTLGLSGFVKGGMTGSAKRGAVQGAKEMAKKAEKVATKNVGKALSKLLAQGGVGVGDKQLAINIARGQAYLAAKEAKKICGQLFSKELQSGVITKSVEEAWKGGTKMTANKFVLDLGMKFISTGGQDVCETVSKKYFEDAVEASLKQALKQNSAKTMFYITKPFAVNAALEEFEKNYSKFVVKNGIFATLEGIINTNKNSSDNDNSYK